MTDPTASSEIPLRAEEAKLDEIYRAAAQIFHDKGYHATSISEIADSVHLTKAGLYYYIKGKQDLLFRIMNFAMDLLEERVIEAARGIEDPEERLRTVVQEHVRLITMDSSALTILVNELEGLTDEHREHLVGRQRAYVELISATLRALADEGKLAEIDPTVAAFGLLGMIQWIPRWYRPDGRVGREEIIEQVQRMTLGAVGLGGRSRALG